MRILNSEDYGYVPLPWAADFGRNQQAEIAFLAHETFENLGNFFEISMRF